MSQPKIESSFTKKHHKTAYPAISPSRSSLSAQGKTIIVTGGSAGIGLSIVTSFESAGASIIVIISRNAGRLAETKKSVESLYSGTKFYTFAASITDLDKITSIFNEVRLQINEPDVLVLNAGSSHLNASPLSIPPDSFWHDLKSTSKGT